MYINSVFYIEEAPHSKAKTLIGTTSSGISYQLQVSWNVATYEWNVHN
jgi:hypothetical protein